MLYTLCMLYKKWFITSAQEFFNTIIAMMIVIVNKWCGNFVEKDKHEEENLVRWKPEPIVPRVNLNHPALNALILEGEVGKEINIGGYKCLNFACHNYLGFAGHQEIKEEAVKCIENFGLGTCGSRVFLGTTNIHLRVEKKFAEFFGCEVACLYSHGFSTIASVIPVYAKPNDVIFADVASNFALQKAFDAIRCKVKYFEHNNIDNLVQLLETQSKEDQENQKMAKSSKRFLVVEGIYMNTGQICKLDQMVELKHKYKLRLFIDESISFGTLGPTGRGITEHFNISMDNIDLIMANLEYGFGSIGGICIGDSYMLHDQFFLASGFCYTTSQPPMLAAGTLKALEILEKNPELTEKLKRKCVLIHQAFSQLKGLKLSGDILSPVKHLSLVDEEASMEEQKRALQNFMEKAKEQGIVMTMSSFLHESETLLTKPSIRITCSNLLDYKEISDVGQKLKQIGDSMF